ncbi:hypothetical protein HV824_28715 [Myxococcus sp. AM009]|uniref:hypothetical protein n=1 Tax=unclassified Myxococcus TaxID=2648731 RepID=UPI001595BA3F|nr:MULTISPECIES: hypothetical protein [unclassified Myxococcus]NVJ02080.1 hypothetical protein [Myxococcus sp. AM009]NVJ14819.1 hypothetical protein [Myxococcus sp. AM010]
MNAARLIPALALGMSLTATPALADSASCVPTNVAVFSNRIHVKCAASVAGGIWFFALASSDTAFMNRTLTLLTTALASGRTLAVDYNPSSTAGTSVGCLSSDCRLINWTAMQ